MSIWRPKHSFTRFWNSDVLFVVVGANEFTKSQQTDIRNYFSKLKKYNCIVISQEHYVIDKENKSSLNINDVDTVTKLGVYTWFPYQSSDRCTAVNDITLLDSWVISAQGHFTMNTDFFQERSVRASKDVLRKQFYDIFNGILVRKILYSWMLMELLSWKLFGDGFTNGHFATDEFNVLMFLQLNIAEGRKFRFLIYLMLFWQRIFYSLRWC